MKLTTFSRVLITLAVVAGLFFAFRALAPQFQKDQGAEQGAEQPTTTVSDEATAPSPSPGAAQPASFSFTPPAPVNGRLKGVVELGASGFNSFIIKADEQDRWQLEKAEFGASLVYENMATEEDVRSGLKNYIAGMLNYGVGPKDIHFVVSSAARETDAVQKINKGLKSLGYVVNTVDAGKEGRLAFLAAMPEAYKDKAFVVDMGSGNTKISWMDGGQVRALETYGSKYYQDNVGDEQVYNDVRAKANQIPGARTRTCFIIGGVPFELAKQIRQGKERYTVLRAPAGYTPEGEKQKAGLNIYKAIADATGCDTFVFDWDANFTIGFLLSL